MASIDILRATGYAVQQWKNGGGETREIDRDPAEPYAYRVSWASIGGPGLFSQFPGYQRILTVFEGGPVTLESAGKRRTLEPFEPFEFDGGAMTVAISPTVPSKDLNLFCRRGQLSGSAQHFCVADTLELALSGTRHYLFSLGDIECERAGRLGPCDTLRVIGSGKVRLGAAIPTDVILLRLSL